MSSPVEEIKKRVDIVDLIGSYIRLSKAGANFKAVCPFHNEKTPSFYISPAREIWHCFGCNAGGDVFRFVSMIEGVEFSEALEMLAARSGVVLRREDPRLSGERRSLLNLVGEASGYFEKELSKNNSALEYLKKRGLKEETISNFRLGFAPDGWGNLLGHLTQKGFKEDEVSKAGLVIQSSNPNSRTKFYDRFRSRIMFPISDASGRIVGFSGRIFNKETNEGKYINTPNTVLYDKSKILYLWDRAKSEARKENTCVIVEGQMDALMSHQAGITYTVATSGTSLNKYHLSMIKRLASRILLTFDSDEAGNIASHRTFEILRDAGFSEFGFDFNIIEVPLGKDPADTIKENPELWKDSVNHAKHIISFFLSKLTEKFSGDTYEMRRHAKTLVLPYVALLKDDIEKAHWVQEVSKTLGLKEEPIWDEVKKLSGPKRNWDSKKDGGMAEKVSPKLRRHLVEERILGMIKWKNDILENQEGLIALFSKENAPKLESILANGSSDFEAELSRLALEAELLYSEDENIKPAFTSLISELEREAVKTRLETLTEEIRMSEAQGEKEKTAQFLKEFQEVSNKLNILWQKAKLKK